MFGLATGVVAFLSEGDPLPGAPRGFSWRPLGELSIEELRWRAADYRQMSAVANTMMARDALQVLADRFDALAGRPQIDRIEALVRRNHALIAKARKVVEAARVAGAAAMEATDVLRRTRARLGCLRGSVSRQGDADRLRDAGVPSARTLAVSATTETFRLPPASTSTVAGHVVVGQ